MAVELSFNSLGQLRQELGNQFARMDSHYQVLFLRYEEGLRLEGRIQDALGCGLSSIEYEADDGMLSHSAVDEGILARVTALNAVLGANLAKGNYYDVAQEIQEMVRRERMESIREIS
jgi:hypothetical protein